MTTGAPLTSMLSTFDEATRRLVQLAAVVAVADEGHVRAALVDVASEAPAAWIDELILQSYLFCGFPRALNAMREWRRVSGGPPHRAAEAESTPSSDWRARGEATCRRVYGGMYEQLRSNIRGLHPALDEWMIVEGYGKVLSRPGLDLPRRELCIIAACAASRQERQLHSHLHGALNVGVAAPVVSAAIEALVPLLDEETYTATRLLWRRVQATRRGV